MAIVHARDPQAGAMLLEQARATFNIQDIVLAGTQQAMAAFVDRSGRTDK